MAAASASTRLASGAVRCRRPSAAIAAGRSSSTIRGRWPSHRQRQCGAAADRDRVRAHRTAAGGRHRPWRRAQPRHRRRQHRPALTRHARHGRTPKKQTDPRSELLNSVAKTAPASCSSPTHATGRHTQEDNTMRRPHSLFAATTTALMLAASVASAGRCGVTCAFGVDTRADCGSRAASSDPESASTILVPPRPRRRAVSFGRARGSAAADDESPTECRAAARSTGCRARGPRQ